MRWNYFALLLLTINIQAATIGDRSALNEPARPRIGGMVTAHEPHSPSTLGRSHKHGIEKRGFEPDSMRDASSCGGYFDNYSKTEKQVLSEAQSIDTSQVHLPKAFTNPAVLKKLAARAKSAPSLSHPPSKSSHTALQRRAFTQTFPKRKIQVYFHMIMTDTGHTELHDGNVPMDKIHLQMDYLNAVYQPLGFEFELARVNRIRNTTWFEQALKNEKSVTSVMKLKYRTGQVHDLNVFSVKKVPEGRGFKLGQSFIPTTYGRALGHVDTLSALYVLDAIMLSHTAFPLLQHDTPSNRRDFHTMKGGRTLVHEVGHFLGLFHTFEGNCGYPNDHVQDTRPQQGPLLLKPGCHLDKPIPSCTDEDLDYWFSEYPDIKQQDQHSKDAINNFMDYSDDECRTQFTRGQIARMHQETGLWRFFDE